MEFRPTVKTIYKNGHEYKECLLTGRDLRLAYQALDYVFQNVIGMNENVYQAIRETKERLEYYSRYGE